MGGPINMINYGTWLKYCVLAVLDAILVIYWKYALLKNNNTFHVSVILMGLKGGDKLTDEN